MKSLVSESYRQGCSFVFSCGGLSPTTSVRKCRNSLISTRKCVKSGKKYEIQGFWWYFEQFLPVQPPQLVLRSYAPVAVIALYKWTCACSYFNCQRKTNRRAQRIMYNNCRDIDKNSSYWIIWWTKHSGYFCAIQRNIICFAICWDMSLTLARAGIQRFSFGWDVMLCQLIQTFDPPDIYILPNYF